MKTSHANILTVQITLVTKIEETKCAAHVSSHPPQEAWYYEVIPSIASDGCIYRLGMLAPGIILAYRQFFED